MKKIMHKKNKIIICSIFLIVFFIMVLFLNNSYGYFKKRIEGTKVTFNVGTLSYELECVDLTECEATIPANETKIIEVNLTSLNKMNTKYELYYEIISPEELTNIVDGGHLLTENTTMISNQTTKGETKNINIAINNTGSEDVTVKLGIVSSLMNDNPNLEEKQISLHKMVHQKYYPYNYINDYQKFVVPVTGYYKLEAWGAQGGNYNTTYYGGYGAYSTGSIYLEKGEEVYIYVGGKGNFTTKFNDMISGGYNGGGSSDRNWSSSSTATQYKGTGGGATHFSLYNDLLSELSDKKSDILLVAAGGGGAEYFKNGDYYIYCTGGSGGGITGSRPTCSSNLTSNQTSFKLATQEIPGSFTYIGNTYTASFGKGGTQFVGGGGGLYGGAGGGIGTGGGSSYIGNANLSNKVMYCYICEPSSEENTKTISTNNVSKNPISNYAKENDGYAKITLLKIGGNTGYIITSEDGIDGYYKIPANSSKEIDISLLNTNEESSYYELFYEIISPINTTNIIDGGYTSISTSTAKDLINAGETKNISIVINNTGNDDIYIIIDAKKNSGIDESLLEEKEISLNKLIIQKYFVYDYTGDYQTFTVPRTGYYKLETWGAQGGTYNATYYGGYGAYSAGDIYLEKEKEVYVYVGGAGKFTTKYNDMIAGGYNGGGASITNFSSDSTASQYKGTGGGATHISLYNDLLSNLSERKSDILIVAGGGGGSYYYKNTYLDAYAYCTGGQAGGITGCRSTCSTNLTSYLTSFKLATQETPGSSSYHGANLTASFGKGCSDFVGGGGGLYGGTGAGLGTGGGSSYIGNVNLTNKVMYCYECEESSEESTKTISTDNVSENPISNYAKKKNGYARITYISE